MILRSDIVEQSIDREIKDSFLKEVLMTSGSSALALVRKRRVGGDASHAPVLLIHGFGQNRYSWHMPQRSFANYLASAGFDVFNVDLRGHGRSRRFGAKRPRGMDDYIDHDIPRCVEEIERLVPNARPFLVGHSMGGLIAYGAAATSVRGRVAGIVSIGSPYRFGRGSRLLYAFREMVELFRLSGMLDLDPAITLRPLAAHMRKRRAVWDRLPVPGSVWRPQSIEVDLLDEYLRRAFDRTSLRVAVEIISGGAARALKSRDGTRDYAAAFELLDLPLLVVAGMHDGIAPPLSVRPAFERARSADKQYREFPFGHVDLVLGRVAPTTVWATIHEWLRARSGTGPGSPELMSTGKASA